jgi:hypothetical protein
MTELRPEEAKRLIDRIGPCLGYDHTYNPHFPEGRNDVCAICRSVENGSTYGYSVIYLVWKGASGELNHAELIDTRRSKDYMSIDKIVAKDNLITVEVSSGGSYSGSPWKRSFSRRIA